MNRFCSNVLLIVITSIALFSCYNRGNQQQKLEMNGINSVTKECDKVKLFDKYVFDLNQKKIHEIMKTFTTSYTNEIWRVVSFYEDQEILDQHSLEKPWNEQGLTKQFNRVFSGEFIACMGKINFKELFIKGEFVTPDYQVREGEDCRVISIFDESKKEVSIVLSYDFYEDGDKYESSINYTYTLQNCTVKMTNLLLIN